ncbi:MAG: alpha/beta fold hydrolase [Magnetococcales bacterium]|nr:alpha/beta fold hydrolase [Magnetococcales bacterium]
MPDSRIVTPDFHFVMCARAVKDGKFIAEPGDTKFLRVPRTPESEELNPSPSHAAKSKKDIDKWFLELREAAAEGQKSYGNILVFIHGYNNKSEDFMKRHRQLESDLKAAGYKGAVLTFDWPSDDKGLNYLEDRHDAKKTAMQLMTDGIRALSEQQKPDCTINIHLLGHSTGAYVIREAFDDADDSNLMNNSWSVSQIVLIGGDVSSSSMSESDGHHSSNSLYRHCVRLTNYSNLHDSVLTLSNVKRLGVAPRVGRVGLPDDAPGKAVDVDCTDYFGLLDPKDSSVRKKEQKAEIGTFCHSWHIGNTRFASDLAATLKGDLDRSVIPTREKGADGKLRLKTP